MGHAECDDAGLKRCPRMSRFAAVKESRRLIRPPRGSPPATMSDVYAPEGGVIIIPSPRSSQEVDNSLHPPAPPISCARDEIVWSPRRRNSHHLAGNRKLANARHNPSKAKAGKATIPHHCCYFIATNTPSASEPSQTTSSPLWFRSIKIIPCVVASCCRQFPLPP